MEKNTAKFNNHAEKKKGNGNKPNYHFPAVWNKWWVRIEHKITFDINLGFIWLTCMFKQGWKKFYIPPAITTTTTVIVHAQSHTVEMSYRQIPDCHLINSLSLCWWNKTEYHGTSQLTVIHILLWIFCNKHLPAKTQQHRITVCCKGLVEAGAYFS